MTTTNDEMINALLSNDEMSDADRVWMWISISDCDKLAEELQRAALLEDIGMSRVTLRDQFVYGVLRLARPDLFAAQGATDE